MNACECHTDCAAVTLSANAVDLRALHATQDAVFRAKQLTEGRAAMHAGDHPTALRIFTEVVRNDKFNVEAHQGLAEVGN